MKYALYFALFLFTINAIGQTKVEVEKRISKELIPEGAKAYISKNFKTKKIKWFFEKGENHSSYEAKFCEFGSDFSVEFSTDGTLEDVEVRFKFKSLKEHIKSHIEKSLEEVFSNFRVLKTQLQLTTYDPEKITSFFNTNTIPEGGLLELIVLGKTEQSKNRYEILINPEGKIFSMLKLEEKNQLFLQF